MRAKGKIRIPAPPPMHNKGNWVISVSQLARWMSEQAEELGAFMLPETDAQKLLIERNRVKGVLTGDKGRGKEGEELGAFEPGAELHAKVTVLAEGTPGHLASVARHYYELDRDSVRTWEIGAKEVWRVPKPLTKLIHTIGWPLRLRTKYREYGGSWLYPMGDDMISLGFVIGLDHADATLSVHDVLQQFKTHDFIREILDGGERVAWGAKTIPGGGIWGLPSRMHVPGAVLVGDAAGFVDMAALKGVNYAIRSGMIAADSIYDALKAERAERASGLWGSTKAIKDSEVWKDLWKVRNMRPAFQRGYVYGGLIYGMSTVTLGKLPRKRIRAKSDIDERVFVGNAGHRYPTPDGKYIFDKLSSVFLSGNATRDDQPSHIRVQTEVPRALAVTWESMCPAKVYEVQDGSESNGTVTVHVNASNCVQCGAITARGGRLTPPEGGSGPEYTLT
jgi:electron-transferring-flavoprotein dehydrogenase